MAQIMHALHPYMHEAASHPLLVLMAMDGQCEPSTSASDTYHKECQYESVMKLLAS